MDMGCTTCGEHMRKTEAQRLATHSAIYGTTNLPPRGTGLKTIVCQICGNTIDVPTGAKEFACPYCNSIYEVTAPTLQNGWLWPFLGGVIISAIIFTSVGRATVKTLTEATLTELKAATARRKAKLTLQGKEW